jgi:hypothetical protein
MPADIAKANQAVQAKYPGGKVTVVTEGDESGAAVTIPFKTEKDAFAFLTSPTALSPSGATSGAPNINLANTGGMFKSTSHTTSGGNDTYTFQTQPAQLTNTSSTGGISQSDLASLFTITFALTVPHVITSAPGALFTLDRKTAIWKLNWTKSEALTATTGSDAGLVASVSGGAAQDPRLIVAVGFVAIAVGFLVGMFITWRGLLPRPAAAAAVAPAPAFIEQPAPTSAPFEPTSGLPGPPPGAPPPAAS